MLDIELIRQQPEHVARELSRRGKDYAEDVKRVFFLDEQWRSLTRLTNDLNAERNTISVQASKLERNSPAFTDLQKKAKEIKDKVASATLALESTTNELDVLLLSLPNLPSANVPDGKDEKDNRLITTWGNASSKPTGFLDHWNYAEQHDLADFENAVRISGTRQVVYKGNGARLARALESFMMDTHARAGYQEVLPPDFVSPAALVGTSQLPKFAEDLFKLDGLNMYLSPTAEVQLTNMYAGKLIPDESLPIKMCGFSHCFRAEAGSAGRDVKGVIRLHQFRKVELVRIVHPESSYAALDDLAKDAEGILQALKLPYRKILLCTGDMGFGSAITYDLEVWMPSYNAYKEISSITNFEAFQARRAKMRIKKAGVDKHAPPHTLNASGLSIDRTWAAIIENFQDEKGEVIIPEVLQPYMGNIKHL